jgi:hypothetical protein
VLSGGFDATEVGTKVGFEDGSGCGFSVGRGDGALDIGYCVWEREGWLLGMNVETDSGS